MTFTIAKERLTAHSPEGILMGYIAFPQIRAGLVSIDQVATEPAFRHENVAEVMMETLLVHLDKQGKKAALTCPFAQAYIEKHSQWRRILPGEIHFTRH